MVKFVYEFPLGSGFMVNEHNFKGKWICADMTIEDRFAPVFKKELIIDKAVDKAQAFVSGLGLFELRINGELADDTLLNPAHTQYSKTVLYREFDIKNLLKEGKNEIVIFDILHKDEEKKLIFGEKSCYILKVRSHGGCEI